MNRLLLSSLVLLLLVIACKNTSNREAISLFDGKTFSGWEGDTLTTWSIKNGTIVGGSLNEMVPHNDFLCTKNSYTNFILQLKIKLTGHEGFVNSGIQFRSKRL